MNLLDQLKVFWISFAASAIVAWPIYRWLKSTVSQKIDPFAPESHQAKQGTPTMGGLIILVGVAAGLFALPGAVKFSGWGDELSREMLAIVVLLVGFALIGFADDFLVPHFTGKRGLGWKQKIVPEFLVATGAGLCMLAIGWDLVAFVFLVLFFSNAFNFVDGLDGLSGSVWLALAVGLWMMSARSPTLVQPLTVVVSAGVIVFLLLNAPPARVFMGDVASLPIGAFLGAAIWMLGPTGSPDQWMSWLPLLILSLLMIAELVPVPMQVAYYKLTKGKRLFPATPIHHGFEKKGWPESRVTWTFALFQLLLSLAAVTLYQLQQQSPG